MGGPAPQDPPQANSWQTMSRPMVSNTKCPPGASNEAVRDATTGTTQWGNDDDIVEINCHNEKYTQLSIN